MSEITEKEYRQLKAEVEEAKVAAERAQGALDSTIERLKREFDVDNIKEAKNKLAALDLRLSIAQKDFEKAFKTYQNKWHGREEDDEDDDNKE